MATYPRSQGSWLGWAAATLLGVLLVASPGCSTVDHVDIPSDPDGSVDGGTVPPIDGAPGQGDGAACVPNDLADCAGYCGKLIGRCGGVVDCKECPAGLTCGAGGPNICGDGTCTPTCAGKSCGATDGCGGTCMTGSCGIGQHCDGGACVCDPTSCSGCCSGSTCQAGSSTSACGSGGAICAKCSAGSCSGGVCSGCTPSCTGVACGGSDGCGGTCTTGTCGTGQACAGGKCICDTTSCTGCCSGSTCAAGTSGTACGSGGQTCQTCGSTQTCTGGSCHSAGAPFLTDCSTIVFFGCAQACSTAGGTCVAKCGPNGDSGAESFGDAACTTGAQWMAGDQCSTQAIVYGRCCCQ